jgi:hypothetical protein
MAKYDVTGPDGQTYEVEAPDSATEAEIMAYVQKNTQQRPGIGNPLDAISGINRNIGTVGDSLVAAYNLMLPKSQEVQPLSQGMRQAGIDLDRPRSLFGMAGEYLMPGPGGAKANLLQTGLAAVGGYAARQAAPDSMLAEMAGALAPNAAIMAAKEAPRLAFVGGQAARDRFAHNTGSFMEATGTTPSPAQAGGSTLTQFLEKGFAPTPGGAVAAHRRGMEQQAQFAETVSARMGVDADTPPAIGKAFREGDMAHLGEFRAKSKVLWDRATKAFSGAPKGVPQIYPVVTTKSAFDDIVKTTPERDIVEAGLDSKIKKIGEFLDTYKSGMSVPGMRRLKDLAADLLEPGLDYKPRQAGLADKLYGAMVTDMQEAAKQMDAALLAKGIKPKPGMKASEILQEATDYHAAEMKRRQLLPSNMKEMSDYDLGTWLSNETDANALLVAKHNAGAERWAKIRGAKIGSMLLAPPSKQTQELRTSSESLLTNYQAIAKKDPKILDAWFGAKGTEYRDNLEAVIKASSDMRKSSQLLINPSGSGAAGITGATLGAAAMGAMTGNVGLSGVIMGYMAGTYGGMRVWLNSPKLLKYLAGTVKDPPGAIEGRIAKLAAIYLNDPEERRARDEMVAKLKAAQ